MSQTKPNHDIMLEYRIAVLEGIINWMLTNGVFVKSIESSEMKQIHEQAVNLVRRRYPDVDIEFEGRWLR